MSASARPSCLVVYCDHERVGELRDTEPLGFEYDAAWLNRASPQVLAAIPLRAGVLSTPAVLAFFENLLPEADLRANLTLQHKATGLFAMLWAVAGDTSGAFVLLPAGETPQAAHYVDTTWVALAKTIQTYSAAALSTLNLPGAEPAAPGTATRISLAGAQDKASSALTAWPRPLRRQRPHPPRPVRSFCCAWPNTTCASSPACRPTKNTKKKAAPA